MNGNWIRERIGWEPYLRPFLFKKLPQGTGWMATLGNLSVLLFVLLFFTGIVLAMYYNPSPDKACQSIDYIMNEVPMGSILRGLHHWGAGAMVLVVFVHLLATFFSGSYKAPRELTWIVGVVLFLVTLGLGFTGYLLPWDMKAYWATVVSSSIVKSAPGIGDYMGRIMLGGESVSGLTLTRFYAIHMLLLPALLVILVVMHIYLVRVHGLAEHAEAKSAESEIGRPVQRFFPEHLFRSSIVFCVVLVILIGLSVFGTVPREEMAGTIIDSYQPKPEWYYMWLFQLLTYFSGIWETIVSLIVPVVAIAVLFLVPFLGHPNIRSLADRPAAMAMGVTGVVCIVYLNLMGFASVRPYGETIPVPDRTLSAHEKRGLFVYVERECAYCHQISGRGGNRVGPDLANVASKGRTEDYLNRYVKNPQAVKSTSIMPKYDLSDKDLTALSGIMLALDFSKYPMKIMKREEVLKSISASQSSTTENVQAHLPGGSATASEEAKDR
ncbi:cytochrome b N-terminal domain-containing protein [Desulfomonile tiedjei]|uniref:Cytochrome b subunit of the bc complex n=1 Tax=Desulfomonile tiedjei (strain ATCC 49306 / DSM 6799 / DCB-1) TaxID=706587 RepID=I4C4V8_DESTA|nr:cytochrome b N-terminal domain-containing protein [Desulfomonile tiedjei]AFM24599.1 cytochrome b subunit of the bc complex [Desulfomonile tiedjei DSM 6799]